MASFYTKWMQDVQDAQNCASLCPAEALHAPLPSPPLCSSKCVMVAETRDTHYAGKYHPPVAKSAEDDAESCEAACLLDNTCVATTYTKRPKNPCMHYTAITRAVTKEAPNSTNSAVKCAAGSAVAASCGHFFASASAAS